VLLPFVIGYFILKTFTGSLLVGGITYALNLFSGKTKDPYGSFHVSLNASSNSSSVTSSQTEWLNMGYWKVRFFMIYLIPWRYLILDRIPIYSLLHVEVNWILSRVKLFTNCNSALALKVAQAARLGTASKSSRVLGRPVCRSGLKHKNKMQCWFLDVGHGTGESLLFLLTDPSIIRPQSIIGITSLEAHHQRSRERVDKVLNTLPGTQPDVELYHGDAVFRPEENRTDHPLNPKSSSPPFTAILALDCAYHFNTREEFLRQSHLRLARSGRVALADICFVAGSTSRLYTTVLLTMLGVPRANAITIEEYRRAMESAGFVDIEVEDISDHVFPGFSQFLRTQGGAWWLFGTAIAALGRSGARYLIISGAKRVV
jgi:SAM-dependent methyltransferase